MKTKKEKTDVHIHDSNRKHKDTNVQYKPVHRQTYRNTAVSLDARRIFAVSSIARRTLTTARLRASSDIESAEMQMQAKGFFFTLRYKESDILTPRVLFFWEGHKMAEILLKRNMGT